MINLHRYDYLIGTQINRLKILEVDKEKSLKNGHIYMKCECQCENKTKLTVYVYSLLNNNTYSCGCYNKERMNENYKNRSMGF